MAHTHDVNGAEIDFIINPATRTLTNNTNKTQIIQFDHNSERFTFELPRYIDGHDMSLCNKTEVHYINIGMDGTQNKGVYAVDDIAVSSDDDNVVIFSWLISANATQRAGSLNFIIRFVCLTDYVIEYAWHTNIYNSIKIKDGMNNGEEVVTEYADILEQWKKELELSIGGAFYTKEEIDTMLLNQVDLTKVTTITEGEADITQDIIDPTSPSEVAHYARGTINVTGYCEIEVENTGIDCVELIINGESYWADGESLGGAKISFKGVVIEPIPFAVEYAAVAKFTRFVATSEYILRNEIKQAVNESSHTTKEELDTRTLSDLDLTTDGIVTWDYDHYDIAVSENEIFNATMNDDGACESVDVFINTTGYVELEAVGTGMSGCELTINGDVYQVYTGMPSISFVGNVTEPIKAFLGISSGISFSKFKISRIDAFGDKLGELEKIPIENGAGENSLQQTNNTAFGKQSFAEGYNTVANIDYSHTEGYDTETLAKAYRIKTIDKNSYLIKFADGTTLITDGVQIGMRLSFLNSEYKFTAEIKEIVDETTILLNKNDTPTITAMQSGELKENILVMVDGGAYGNEPFDFEEGIEVSSHAEGCNTKAYVHGHAEGKETEARGHASHAEGRETIAHGEYSHTEGYYTEAWGLVSHSEGAETKSFGNHSHAEGKGSQSLGGASHAEGNITQSIGENSHAEGFNTRANGGRSHAEGASTQANGKQSHAEGNEAIADGDSSHAEGQKTQAVGIGAHAEGVGTKDNGSNIANGIGAHTEGYITLANGDGSHAEGNFTKAEGRGAHAEGYSNPNSNIRNTANGEGSHVEGYGNTANGEGSHVEGKNNSSPKPYEGIHVEGMNNTAHGARTHVEGYNNKVYAHHCHVEGINNVIGTEDLSKLDAYAGTHISGTGNQASAANQFILGKYNEDKPDALLIVGNGKKTKRANAFTVDTLGNGWFAGDVAFTYNGTVCKVSDLLSRIASLEIQLKQLTQTS